MRARPIKISVEAGGKKLIQITDNGCGMVRDDAMLAFERHATSKIKDAEDLLSVATLGFRGEALPSIDRCHACGWRHAQWNPALQGRSDHRRHNY